MSLDDKLFRVLRLYAQDPDNIELGVKFASMYLRIHGVESPKFRNYGVASYDAANLSFNSWQWLVDNAEYIHKLFPRSSVHDDDRYTFMVGPYIGGRGSQSLIMFIEWLDDAEKQETYDIDKLGVPYDSQPPDELLEIMIEANDMGFDWIEFHNAG